MRKTLGIQPQKPSVELLSLEIQSIGFDKIDMLVNLNVTNHSSVDLELLSLDYEIVFLESPLASGTFATKTMLKEGSPQVIPLPVNIVIKNFLSLSKAIFKKDVDEDLHFLGQAHVDTVMGEYNFKYDQKKKISSLIKKP